MSGCSRRRPARSHVVKPRHAALRPAMHRRLNCVARHSPYSRNPARILAPCRATWNVPHQAYLGASRGVSPRTPGGARVHVMKNFYICIQLVRESILTILAVLFVTGTSTTTKERGIVFQRLPRCRAVSLIQRCSRCMRPRTAPSGPGEASVRSRARSSEPLQPFHECTTVEWRDGGVVGKAAGPIDTAIIWRLHHRHSAV